MGALLLLTLINLFNYLDRYILMALSPAMKRDLNLTDTEVGFLATAFMYSYFLVSPFFGWFGDKGRRYPLMAAGVGVWSLATVTTGLSRNFASLIASRFFVGVGEAAYGAISPSLLTDLYPKSIRGKVFAVFFLAIPVGSALGYLLGGLLEGWIGWRMAFVVAGLPGILLAFSLFFLKEPERGAFDAEKPERLPLKEVVHSLYSNSSYALTILGYCAYTFVLGGIAVWIPHYIERYLGVSAAQGNIAFGAITVLAGFAGTFVGGAWADRWAQRGTDGYLKLSALSMFVSVPIYLMVMQVSSFYSFCVLVFFLEFLLFLSTSPINAQIVNCVSPSMRATANAAGIFFIHLLGDSISPPLVGKISDLYNLHAGMMIFVVAIFLSGLIWAWKVIFYWEALPWPEQAPALPLVQVHRGLYGKSAVSGGAGLQENTIAAFQAAASAGAKMVELDVRLSGDGVVVVFHDEDLKRLGGSGELVRDITAAQLKSKAQAPTLEEVLKTCPELSVNVEIKSKSRGDEGLERAVAAVVNAAGAQKRVIFSSFNPLALRRISKVLPQVPRALLVTEENDPENKIYLKKLWLAFMARPHMVNVDRASLGGELLEGLRKRGVPFAVWTVEDSSEAQKFLALGAKSIISPKVGIV